MAIKVKRRPATALPAAKVKARSSAALHTLTPKPKVRSAASVTTLATRAKARPLAGPGELEPLDESWAVPPSTMEEGLQRIQTLGQRIKVYVQFICAVGKLDGSSAEAKQKAVAVFYDRLLLMEQELGRIQEALRLG
jgi:hypothetical protein